MQFRIMSFFYALLTMLVSLLLAWIILAIQNFNYGFWHDNVGIAEGIARFGPQNRYRYGFENTSRAERVALFAGINRAIHRSGHGLDHLVFNGGSKHGEQTLLRTPELVHLRDVARLIDIMKLAFVVIIASFIALTIYFVKRARRMPAATSQLYSLFVTVFIGLLIVAVIGPQTVFNTLHIWAFPSDHQWFFYYQDSLMSTMMLAPTLFAWIAVSWLASAIAVFSLIQYVLGRLRKRYLPTK